MTITIEELEKVLEENKETSPFTKITEEESNIYMYCRDIEIYRRVFEELSERGLLSHRQSGVRGFYIIIRPSDIRDDKDIGFLKNLVSGRMAPSPTVETPIEEKKHSRCVIS